MLEFLSLLVLLTGVAFSVWYLRITNRPVRVGTGVIGGPRPWRRVGAGICLLLGVMFVVGLYNLEAPRSPRSFILYWITILLLVLWLCALAIKDLLHTRSTIARWRAGKATLDGTPIEPQRDAKESDS